MASFPTEFADAIFGDNGDNVIDALGGDDLIAGSGGDDTLFGNEGNDILLAGLGLDTLDGGNGRDGVSYFGYSGGVTAKLFDGLGFLTALGAADHDELISIENLTGSNFDDILWGNDKANTIQGNGGKDSLVGYGGKDRIIGGEGDDLVAGGSGADVMSGGGNSEFGFDRLWYAASAAAVQVNLLDGTAQGGDAEGDSFNGFEAISGSGFNDILTGNGKDNSLQGFDGADTLTGGGGWDSLDGGKGKDVLDGGSGEDYLEGGESGDQLIGGSGIDTAAYWFAAAGISVNLSTGKASGGDAAGDTYFSIENVYGTYDHDDTLTGNGSANTLIGFDGDDELSGLGNGDDLSGGKGDDTLLGGGGNDKLFGGNAPGAASDKDVIEGGAGDDTIAGELDADQLDGGAGADTFYYFGVADSTAAAFDTITGFESGIDNIDFTMDMDATLAGVQTGYDVIGQASFTAGNAGQVRFFASGGGMIAQVEVTGDGKADMAITFAGINALAAGDFI